MIYGTYEEVTEFFRVYRVTPSTNSISGKSPTKLIFARIIKKKHIWYIIDIFEGQIEKTTKHFEIGNTFRICKKGKEHWGEAFVTRICGNML